MKYRKGYKYQLAEDEYFKTSFALGKDIITKRIHLLADGTLIVCEGYAWDGTSGPVIDRKTNQRASCGHDALYELMRKGKLPHVLWKSRCSFCHMAKRGWGLAFYHQNRPPWVENCTRESSAARKFASQNGLAGIKIQNGYYNRKN